MKQVVVHIHSTTVQTQCVNKWTSPTNVANFVQSSGGFNDRVGGSSTATVGRSGTSGVSSANTISNNNASGVGRNGRNNSEMVEEEMIAEAIALSLWELQIN